MSDPVVVYTILWACAFAAGAINSVAGGGTLLTFPSLQHVFERDTNPLVAAAAGILANATSTVALMPGSIAGAVAYRRELAQCRRLVLLLLAPSVLGGGVGAMLVTAFKPEVFNALIPWLILTAALLFVVQGPLKRLTGAGEHHVPGWKTGTLVVIGQFFIAVYGGYFGAGIGILMLATLPFMGTKTIHETNAAKTVLAASINGVTVAVFVVQGIVHWHYALTMAAAAIAGGYAGGRVARRLPGAYVRLVVTIIGFGLAGYYLWKQLGP
jgi:uncharacterized membrane protein YfcA